MRVQHRRHHDHHHHRHHRHQVGPQPADQIAIPERNFPNDVYAAPAQPPPATRVPELSSQPPIQQTQPPIQQTIQPAVWPWPMPKPSDGLAKAGQNLERIFHEQQSGTFDPSAWKFIHIDGDKVGVDVRSEDPNFERFAATLREHGMQITTSSRYYGIVEGMLPIKELERVAKLPETSSISPIYEPQLLSTSFLD